MKWERLVLCGWSWHQAWRPLSWRLGCGLLWWSLLFISFFLGLGAAQRRGRHATHPWMWCATVTRLLCFDPNRTAHGAERLDHATTQGNNDCRKKKLVATISLGLSTILARPGEQTAFALVATKTRRHVPSVTKALIVKPRRLHKHPTLNREPLT